MTIFLEIFALPAHPFRYRSSQLVDLNLYLLPFRKLLMPRDYKRQTSHLTPYTSHPTPHTAHLTPLTLNPG
jgi:hypothetical protein